MKPLFVITLKYLKPIDCVDAVLKDHREYLGKYYDQKKILCSGPQNPRVGGVILFTAQNIEEAWNMVKGDPFYTEGIAEYNIIEFAPTRAEFNY